MIIKFLCLGSRLILETASDPDEGDNGRIVDYFISGGKKNS